MKRFNAIGFSGALCLLVGNVLNLVGQFSENNSRILSIISLPFLLVAIILFSVYIARNAKAKKEKKLAKKADTDKDE